MTHRALIVVFSSLVTAAACGGSKTSAPPVPSSGQDTSVSLARAESADVPSVFEAGGVVRAGLTATVASRILAAVTAVRVRPGDHVQSGQTLVELDTRELNASQARAVAVAAAAAAALSAAGADVQSADAALTQARVTRERVVTLVDKRSATAQERDDAVAAYAAADAHLTGARARLAAASAALDAARAGADVAGIAASYSILRAPFDGVIAARHADPGDIAAPGVALLLVEQSGARHLEATIDEARVVQVALRQEARVHLDHAGDAAASSASHDVITGHVIEIARVDADSHSFVVKIDLPDSAQLRAGLYGRAEFNGPSHRALIIPASALVRRGQLAFVFTVEAGQARLRQVSPGAARPAGVEITAGLSAGESVILSPGDALTDGTRVSVIGK